MFGISTSGMIDKFANRLSGIETSFTLQMPDLLLCLLIAMCVRSIIYLFLIFLLTTLFIATKEETIQKSNRSSVNKRKEKEKNKVRNTVGDDGFMVSIGMKFMGGEEGCESFCVISKNSCNSSHFDHDYSYSIYLFVGGGTGDAKGWNFLLPNVVWMVTKKKLLLYH